MFYCGMPVDFCPFTNNPSPTLQPPHSPPLKVWAQYRSKLIDAKTLPDIGFDILPEFHYLLADVACYGAMLVTFVRFFFGVTLNNFRIRRHIFRRHIFCLGTLFFFRAFSIICTMLPNPADYCVTDVEYSPWYEAFRILSGATGENGTGWQGGASTNYGAPQSHFPACLPSLHPLLRLHSSQ
jgi:hypothetical protein